MQSGVPSENTRGQAAREFDVQRDRREERYDRVLRAQREQRGAGQREQARRPRLRLRPLGFDEQGRRQDRALVHEDNRA